MYLVYGMEQIAMEKKSMSEWCDWMTMGTPDEKPETPRDLLGIMYDSLIGAHMDLQEPLPEKLTLKNNLKIGEYYVFSLSGEFLNLRLWLVMNRNGHIVHAFRWGYGSGNVLPRIDAVWIGMSMYGIPGRENMELHEQGDEMWIFYVDKKKETRQLRSFVQGNVCVVTEKLEGAYCFDWPLEYESPTIGQDELVPILREFVKVQTGESNAVEAEREILSVLPKAKKLRYDHNRRTIRYEYLPPPPRVLHNGMIPNFKKNRKALMAKLKFPDASYYKITEDSGPHPQRLTHCRLEWLKKFGIKYMVQKYAAPASLVCRYLPEERARQAVYIVVAQCGTREFALDSLAQMRLWKTRLEEEAWLKARGEKEWDKLPEPDHMVVAARTNMSDKLVGEYALYLKGSLDKFGRMTRRGMYSSVFFVRGTTVACVIAEDPEMNVLPLACRMDEELKKMHALGPEKREPRIWEPNSDLDYEFDAYLKSKGVDPGTGGIWKEEDMTDKDEPEP